MINRNVFKLLNRNLVLLNHHQRFINESKLIKIENEKLKLETNLKNNYFYFNLIKNDQKLFKDIPYIWLRNNCRCSKCYNYEVEEVELNLQSLSIDDLKPKELKFNKDTNILNVLWQDDHHSEVNIYLNLNIL
jgi:hypothetical protein